MFCSYLVSLDDTMFLSTAPNSSLPGRPSTLRFTALKIFTFEVGVEARGMSSVRQLSEPRLEYQVRSWEMVVRRAKVTNASVEYGKVRGQRDLAHNIKIIANWAEAGRCRKE